jgi:hypothetical protein
MKPGLLFSFLRGVSRSGYLPLLKMTALVTANILFSLASYGQSPQPTLASAPALHANQSATAAVTFSSGASLKVFSGKDGSFPLVAAVPGETVNIQVRFAANRGNTGLTIQALDGGIVPKAQQDSSLASDGTALTQFQMPSQPGSCRVLLIGSGTTATLNFWVADPGNPSSSNAAALKP